MGTNIHLQIRKNKVEDFNKFVIQTIESLPLKRLSYIRVNDKNNQLLSKREFDSSDMDLNGMYDIISNLDWGAVCIGGAFFENASETVSFDKRMVNRDGYILCSYPSATWSSCDGGYERVLKDKNLKEELLQSIRRIISNIDPDIVLLKQADNDEIESYIEYYKDPYFFCIEPPYENDQIIEDMDTSFLEDSDTLNLLTKCRSVMTEEELISITQSKSSGFLKLPNGLAVMRKPGSSLVGALKSFVYPRYFIRKELRKIGVDIPEGLAEKYAKELGIK